MLLEIDLHVLQHLGFVFQFFQCWYTYSHVIPIDHIFLKCEIHVFLITFYIVLFKFLKAIFDLSN